MKNINYPYVYKNVDTKIPKIQKHPTESQIYKKKLYPHQGYDVQNARSSSNQS